jgi:hypothetical protein
MVYVPPVDSVIFPSDNVEKHLNGQHDQSTHSHKGANGEKVTASTGKSKQAMKVPGLPPAAQKTLQDAINKMGG